MATARGICPSCLACKGYGPGNIQAEAFSVFPGKCRGNLDPVSLQPHGAQDLVHAGIEAQVLPVESVSDEDHVADAGLDGSFQPLDRLIHTTEGNERDQEVEVEGEFRAGPLQFLELGEVAQGLLRPSRPLEQVRSSAQAPPHLRA